MTFPSSNEQVWNPDWAQPTTNVALLQDGRYHPNLVGAWTSAVNSSERARLAPVADGVPNQWFHDHDDRPVLAKNLGCSLVGNCPCADIHLCSSSSSSP